MGKSIDIATSNAVPPEGVPCYAYTYGGHKFLKTTELVGGAPETRLYLGGAEFVEGQPESYYHGEGRVALTGDKPAFQYKLTDHLGNTMVLFEDIDGNGIITTESMNSNDPVEVLQRNFYYAFGLPMQGPWNHAPADPDMPYLYNGKELEGELGLGWYAYGFRYYDASVGRFAGVDPLAGEMPDWSSYCYTFNNPIRLVDYWGLSPSEPPVNGLEFFADETGAYYWNNENNNYDRFYTVEGDDQVHVGTYSADEFKEPLGDYTIVFDLSGEKTPDQYNSEHTIETLAGTVMAYYASAKKPWKDISNQSKYPGVKILSHEDMKGAVTLGNMIFTNTRMEDVNTLDHEYGHYLDFKYHFNFNKMAYLKTIGAPSFISASRKNGEHFKSTSEKRANRLGGAWGNNEYLKNVHR